MRRSVERLLVVLERGITAVLYPFCLLRERFGAQRSAAVLMYHQVGTPLPGVLGGEAVSPRAFEAQMRAILSAGYRPVPLGHLLGGRSGLASGSRRPVAVTFDDGYQGQVRHAMPILQRYKVPATFFLVAGALGTGRPLPHLTSGDGDFPHDWLPMTWEQARRIAGEGMSIGSHSLSHRSLGGLSAGQAEAEARRSKDLLEQRAGARVDLFSYPFGSESYGDFDPGIERILRGAGYLGACTTVVGRNRPGADPHALRRIPMEEGDGPFRVRCKLVGAYDWVGPAKSFWQRLVRRREPVDWPLPLEAE